MIQADARELETKLRQQVLGIRNKEVSLFTDQFAVLASSATFMSSLGFGALNMEIGFLERNHGIYCSELVGCDRGGPRILLPMSLFYVFAAAGTAFNLLTVILASFCMIFGPELAIRGTEASMKHAVTGMYEERRRALRYFWAGCFFIILSGIALSWMKFPQLTSAIITGVFTLLLIFCALYLRRLEPKFRYNEDAHVDALNTEDYISAAGRGSESMQSVSQQPRAPRRGLGDREVSSYGATASETHVTTTTYI